MQSYPTPYPGDIWSHPETFLVVTTGMCYPRTVGRIQGCCLMPYNAQDSLPQKRFIQPKMSVVLRLRNPALNIQNQKQCAFQQWRQHDFWKLLPPVCPQCSPPPLNLSCCCIWALAVSPTRLVSSLILGFGAIERSNGTVIKSVHSGDKLPGFEAWVCHLQALWPWAIYLTSLCLFMHL